MNYTELKKLDEKTLKKLTEGPGPADECICNLLAPEERGLKTSIKKAFAKSKEGKSAKESKKGRLSDQQLPEYQPVDPTQRSARDPTKRSARDPTKRSARDPTQRSPPNQPLYKSQPQSKEGKSKKGRTSERQQNEVEVPLVFTPGEKAGNLVSTKEVVKRKQPCGKCGCDKENIVLKHSYANIRITTPDLTSICPCPTTDCMPEKNKLMNNIKVTIERMTIDPDSENSETSIYRHKTIQEPLLLDKKSVSSLINAQYETEEDRLL